MASLIVFVVYGLVLVLYPFAREINILARFIKDHNYT